VKERPPLDSSTPLTRAASIMEGLARKLAAEPPLALTFHDRMQLQRILYALIGNVPALRLLIQSRGQRGGRDGAAIAIDYGIHRELEGRGRTAAATLSVAQAWDVPEQYVKNQWTERGVAVVKHLDESYGERGSEARREKLAAYSSELREGVSRGPKK